MPSCDLAWYVMPRDIVDVETGRERQRGLDVWRLGDQEADVIPADTGRAEGTLGSAWRSRLGGGGGRQCPGDRLERDVDFSGVSLERPGDRMYVQRARR